MQYAQTPLYDYEGSIYDGADSSYTFSVLDPATPLPDFSFGGEPDYQPHQYATAPNATSPGCGPTEPARVGGPDPTLADYGYQSTTNLTLGGNVEVSPGRDCFEFVKLTASDWCRL
jgi:hypothetical protein